LTASFDFGGAFGFAADPLPVRVDRPAAGFATGRFAGVRLLAAAAGFRLAGVFAADLRADDRPLAARGNLRAGFTCFLAMVILVR
jgi:hypothetical protein